MFKLEGDTAETLRRTETPDTTQGRVGRSEFAGF
jgi:hypothetical protein